MEEGREEIREQQKTCELEALAAVSAAISGSLDPEEILQQLVQTTVDELDFEISYLTVYSEEERAFRVRYIYPQDERLEQALKILGIADLGNFRFPAVGAALEQIETWRRGKVIISDFLYEFLKPHISPEAAEAAQQLYGVRQVIELPLRVHDEVKGTFLLATQHPKLEPSLLQLLQAIANQTAIALEKAEIYQEAVELKDKYRYWKKFNEEILENTPIGIVRLDREGKILYESPAMRQILGVPEGRVGMLGMKITGMPNIIEAGIISQLEELLAGRSFKGLEAPLTSLYGKQAILSVDGLPLVDREGELNGAMLLIRDITIVKQAERLRRGLLEVAGEILTSYDIEHILRRVAQAIIDHSPFQRAAVSLYDLKREPPLEGALTQAVAVGLTAEEEQKLRESGGLTPEQRRLAFSEQFRVSESCYIPHERIPWEPGLGVPGKIKLDGWHPDDFLFIPLRGERGIIGHISVDDPTTPRAPTLEMLEPLELFAKLAALAIERAAHLEQLRHQEEELRRLSIHDPLTGLYNRHHFNEIIGRELERSHRYGHYLAFLMIDLDDFHEINNRYGHLRGDEVLCQIAELLVNNVHSADMVFRYGGDEFLILMPETDSEVRDVTERLGRAIAEWNKGSGLDCHVGISIGATSWSPDEERRIEEVLEEADQRMYQAKRGKSPSV